MGRRVKLTLQDLKGNPIPIDASGPRVKLRIEGHTLPPPPDAPVSPTCRSYSGSCIWSGCPRKKPCPLA